MKKLFLSLILATIILSPSAKSQLVGEDYDVLQFQRKVKMIGQFMQRFNMDELPPGLNPSDTLLKEKSFAALLDYSLVEKNPDGVLDFLNLLAKDTVKLTFTDTNWRAYAQCAVLLDGKPSALTLVLRTQHVTGYRYKWTICDAFGEALQLTPQKVNPGLRIDPTDNEMNFMSLKNITEKESANILNYKSESEELHGLSVFLSLVKYGKLLVSHVEKLTYTFNCPQYRFTVSKYNREGYNTGWLISDYQIKKHKKVSR